MLALRVAKLKMFLPESEIFLCIKPKKKKNFFVESLDQCQRLEVREKARNVFCGEPTSVLSQGVTNIASSSSFFRIGSDFLAFFARISYFNCLELKETIIPFALVGYETGYLPSLIQRRSWNNC